MEWVAGVDGCPAGWAVVMKQVGAGVIKHAILSKIGDVSSLPEKPSIVAIDMPIGLLRFSANGTAERA